MDLNPSRRLLLSVVLMLSASCVATPSPRAAQKGDWHFSGGSRGLLETQDGGDFGDRDRLGAEVTGGRFLSDKWLLEGSAALSYDSTEDDTTNADVDTRAIALGVGMRYYFDAASIRRIYVALLGGLADLDIDVDGGVDDSDTAPLLQARLGMESFLTDTVAIDFGLAAQNVFGLELGTADDDITSVGIFAGISIWP